MLGERQAKPGERVSGPFRHQLIWSERAVLPYQEANLP